MANRLSMAKINAIQTLHHSGHSNRKIARLLGVDRGSVGKYVRQLQHPPERPAGGGPPAGPSDAAHQPGPASACEPLREVITALLERGLSARRIFQDLRAEHAFTGSYYSVRRFVTKLQSKTPLPVRRMETAAGEEAQVDFGSGAPEHLRSDNGPEFVAQAVTRWLDRAGVKTLFIAKGSPWENGYVESFNSRFRDELLDRELFIGLEDARWVVDRWRLDYNHHRPHSSLGYQTPAAFATRCCSSVRPTASLQSSSGPLTPDPLIPTGR